MPKWLKQFLRVIYLKLPPHLRPMLREQYEKLLIRAESATRFRRIYTGNRVEFLDFEIADLGPYEFLGPEGGEVLVESHCSLVSPGTERAVLCGLPGARFEFPFTPGYSAAGSVLKVGKRVKGFEPGDRVAGTISHTSHQTLSATRLFKIPEGVSDDEACFIELGIITLQGIRKAGIKPGDRVAVVGQGLIGQLSARLASLAGASSIVAVAATRNREKSATLGGIIDEFVCLSESPHRVREIQADVVIEAVGTPQAITVAMDCARVGAKVVLAGSSRGLSRGVDWWSLAQQRGLTMVGAHISAVPAKDASHGRWTREQEGRLFLELLQTGRLKVRDLITWRAKPSESNAVYEVLVSGGREHVGIVFCWNGDGASAGVKSTSSNPYHRA